MLMNSLEIYTTFYQQMVDASQLSRAFRFVSMRIPLDFFSVSASFDQKREGETIVVKFVLNDGNKRAKIFYGSGEKGRE